MEKWGGGIVIRHGKEDDDCDDDTFFLRVFKNSIQKRCLLMVLENDNFFDGKIEFFSMKFFDKNDDGKLMKFFDENGVFFDDFFLTIF